MELITNSQQKKLKKCGYWDKLSTGEEVAFLPGYGTVLFIYHYHFEVIPDSMEKYKGIIIKMIEEYDKTDDVYQFEVHSYELIKKHEPFVTITEANNIVEAVESILVKRAIDKEGYKHD